MPAAEAAFDVVAVNPEGTRIAMPVRVRLVRERPNWRIVRRGNLARYESVWRDEPLETQDVTIAADQPLHFSKKLGFGRYRVEVAQTGGMAISSYRFYSGWVTSQSPDVPDRVVVSTDRKSIPAGETAHIHIAAPFAGEATLLVMSDRVHSVRTLPVSADGTDVDVPVDASWGPGAYVAVHVFRGGGGAAPGTPRPDRAIGLVWVGVDPAARTLPLAIQAPDKTTPRGLVIDPGQDRAGRLGDAGDGGRGHPASDQLHLARPGTAFPRPPRPGHRHPRRLGPADRPRRRRADAAAPGRRRGRQRAAGNPAAHRHAVHPADAGGRRRHGAHPARTARLQRAGAADGGGLAGQPHRLGQQRHDRARRAGR